MASLTHESKLKSTYRRAINLSIFKKIGPGVKARGKLEKLNIWLSIYKKNNYQNQAYSITLCVRRYTDNRMTGKRKGKYIPVLSKVAEQTKVDLVV